MDTQIFRIDPHTYSEDNPIQYDLAIKYIFGEEIYNEFINNILIFIKSIENDAIISPYTIFEYYIKTSCVFKYYIQEYFHDRYSPLHNRKFNILSVIVLNRLPIYTINELIKYYDNSPFSQIFTTNIINNFELLYCCYKHSDFQYMKFLFENIKNINYNKTVYENYKDEDEYIRAIIISILTKYNDTPTNEKITNLITVFTKNKMSKVFNSMKGNGYIYSLSTKNIIELFENNLQ
jgi:hypothetical protein